MTTLRSALLQLGVLAALGALAARPASAEPTLAVDLAVREAHVGDQVAATITLRAPEELAGEPRFPAWEKTWGDLEIVSVKAPERQGDGVYRQQMVLAPFKTGNLALPAMAIEVPLAGGTVSLKTPADLTLTVVSVLPAPEQKPEPKPAAPPAPLPLGKRFWWAAGVGTALCTLAGALLYWRRRTAVTEAAALSTAPVVAPLPELLLELDTLQGLAAGPESEAAHTRLSLALRRFLGRSLDFNALESTTSEIRRDLRERGVPREVAATVLEVLRACDGVKFARQAATAAAAKARLQAARDTAQTLAAFCAPPERTGAVPESAPAEAAR